MSDKLFGIDITKPMAEPAEPVLPQQIVPRSERRYGNKQAVANTHTPPVKDRQQQDVRFDDKRVPSSNGTDRLIDRSPELLFDQTAENDNMKDGV